MCAENPESHCSLVTLVCMGDLKRISLHWSFTIALRAGFGWDLLAAMAPAPVGPGAWNWWPQLVWGVFSFCCKGTGLTV